MRLVAWMAFVSAGYLVIHLAVTPVPMPSSAADRIFAHGFDPPEQEACKHDRDDDRLRDCVETHSGVFRGPGDTGTDPDQADTDNDGLTDGDEVMGSVDGLDLPGLGVNPLRKDLLVEYDWFIDDLECDGAHTHKLTDETLIRIRTMFANAPVPNPDGSIGVNIIQDLGQGGLLDGGGQVEVFDANLPGALDSVYRQIRETHQNPNRQGYFHYLLLAHSYNNGSASSGFGEIIGDDAIVTLGCYQTQSNATRTVIHELGHNLGLNHGGFESCNGKPNYNSLMNYRYQFSGLDEQCLGLGTGGDNYSFGLRYDLDEVALVEADGMCEGIAVDWNRNNTINPSPISLNLNPEHDDSCFGALTVLRDFDDWGHLTFLGILDSLPTVKAVQKQVICPAPTPRGRFLGAPGW